MAFVVGWAIQKILGIIFHFVAFVVILPFNWVHTTKKKPKFKLCAYTKRQTRAAKRRNRPTTTATTTIAKCVPCHTALPPVSGHAPAASLYSLYKNSAPLFIWILRKTKTIMKLFIKYCEIAHCTWSQVSFLYMPTATDTQKEIQIQIRLRLQIQIHS